jgi:hypothetical protein
VVERTGALRPQAGQGGVDHGAQGGGAGPAARQHVEPLDDGDQGPSTVAAKRGEEPGAAGFL